MNSEEKTGDSTKETGKGNAQIGKKGMPEKLFFFALILGVIIVFAGLVYFFALKQANPAGTQLPDSNVPENTGLADSVAATVNGEKIMLSEVEKRFKTVPDSLAGQVSKTSILQNMIDGKLVLQEAAKNNVTVDANEVEQVFSQQKDAADQIIKLGGFTEQEVKDSIRESLIVQKYLNDFIFSKLDASEAEISAFFEANKGTLKEASAAHILVADENKATKLLAQLKGGADFAKLAKENSIDTASGAQGGELGFFKKSDMVSEFGDAAFALKPGELSGAVKSQFGYHIILLHEFKEAGIADFKDQIKQALVSQKSDKAYTDHLAELTKKAKIELVFKESQ
ncbi:MAG: peptidylprolyl isomerase [archaeon]